MNNRLTWILRREGDGAEGAIRAQDRGRIAAGEHDGHARTLIG